MSPVYVPTRVRSHGGIDTTVEQTLPLAKAARQVASVRCDGHAHPGTLHRWRLFGINGVRLECIKVGGVWHTSPQALQRFFERVTAAEQAGAVCSQPTPARPVRSQPVEQSDHDTQIESELAAVLGRAPAGNRRPEAP
jgi:hypothetical protein